MKNRKTEEDQIRYEKSKQQKAKICRDKMNAVLLDFQKKLIDAQIGIVVSRSQGPIYDLAIGSFGEQIGIDKEKRKAIERKAKKLQKELVELCKEVEQKAIDQFVATLVDDQKKELKKLIDISIDRPDCVGLLIYRLAN